MLLKEVDEVDLRGIRSLLEDELVIRYVPVANRVVKWHFKHHFALLGPHLEKKWLMIIVLKDFLVNYLNKNGAEIAFFVVITACDDLVKLVKRRLILDVAHKLPGRLVLVT